MAATKAKEKEFTYTVVLIDGTSFMSEPMSEHKAHEAAEQFLSDGVRNENTYYPASQIKRVKINEHVQ